jgi:hypothetical protein
MLAVVFPFVMQLAAPLAPAPRAHRDTTDSVSVDGAARVLLPTDTTPRRKRPHAIEYSDWYATRLTIHKIGAFASLPLYPTEYVLGDKLLNGTDVGSWVKPTHIGVAAAIGGIFAVNTITGLWNLWDSRKDTEGRTRRVVHSLIMLSSDAGFAATAFVAGDANESGSDARLHRNLAVGSMAVGAAGTVLMWLWKD